MVKHTLSDDFKLKGLWWLPETPERRVPGIVTFDNDGINLELFGYFQKPTSSYRDPIWNPKTILGRAEGSLVTLYQALTTESPASRPAGESQGIRLQLHRSIFDVAHMFIGAHFESEAEIQFTSLEANFTHLEEWMEKPVEIYKRFYPKQIPGGPRSNREGHVQHRTATLSGCCSAYRVA